MLDRKNFVANGNTSTPTRSGIGNDEFIHDPHPNDDVAISCYDSEVPSFVAPELDRLYGNIFCSAHFLRVYGGLTAHTSTYVVRRNQQIVTIFLFLREGGRVEVINKGMKVGEEELVRFAGHIFSAYPSVNVISFLAVSTDLRTLPFPYQCIAGTEDIVATVPASREAYLASLGKSTRGNMHRYEKRLRRSFPSFCVKIYQKDEVKADDLRTIAKLNRARMAAKAKVSGNDDEEAERLIALVRKFGVVCVATIDGQVCAGVVTYRIGSAIFMHVIAHDSQYDDYRLGTITCFLAICECIGLGCQEYHFLWGRYAYKYRLGGVRHDLDHLTVYRSRVQFLLNGDVALKAAAAGWWRSAKLWLLEQGEDHGQSGLTSRVVFNLVNGLRRLKRSRARWWP
jgi:hypothetical protein